MFNFALFFLIINFDRNQPLVWTSHYMTRTIITNNNNNKNYCSEPTCDGHDFSTFIHPKCVHLLLNVFYRECMYRTH